LPNFIHIEKRNIEIKKESESVSVRADEDESKNTDSKEESIQEFVADIEKDEESYQKYRKAEIEKQKEIMTQKQLIAQKFGSSGTTLKQKESALLSKLAPLLPSGQKVGSDISLVTDIKDKANLLNDKIFHDRKLISSVDGSENNKVINNLLTTENLRKSSVLVLGNTSNLIKVSMIASFFLFIAIVA